MIDANAELLLPSGLSDITQPIWKRILTGSELQPNPQNLLLFFCENVLEGPADQSLRNYGYESFEKLCKTQNVDPINLQEQFMTLLPRKEIQRLFTQVSKGLKVRVHSTLYHDGSSPSHIDKMRKIIEKSGINVENDDGTYRKLQQEVTAGILNSDFTNQKPVFSNTQEGIVVAEELQGYSIGVRILGENGEDQDIPTDDVDHFVITGNDKELAKRRPREIYPGKQIGVWVEELQQWVPALVDKKTLRDSLQVRLNHPISIPDDFGSLRQLTLLEVNIGFTDITRSTAARETTSSLPELGSGDFETKPWLFESIDVTGERTESPYIEVPQQFRPGKLVQFSDGRIGKVQRTSTQGFCEIDSGGRPKEFKWATTNESHWPTKLPIEVDDNSKLLTNCRVRLQKRHLNPPTRAAQIGEKSKPKDKQDVERLLDFMSKPENKKLLESLPKPEEFIVKVAGVFIVGEIKQVVLESLPVTSGNGANKLDQKFYTMPVEQFNTLREQGKISVSPHEVSKELRQRFPQIYDDIVKKMTKFGDIWATIQTKNGKTYATAYLHSLPFGIWLPPDEHDIGGKPQLVPLEQIASITNVATLTEASDAFFN